MLKTTGIKNYRRSHECFDQPFVFCACLCFRGVFREE